MDYPTSPPRLEELRDLSAFLRKKLETVMSVEWDCESKRSSAMYRTISETLENDKYLEHKILSTGVDVGRFADLMASFDFEDFVLVGKIFSYIRMIPGFVESFMLPDARDPDSPGPHYIPESAHEILSILPETSAMISYPYAHPLGGLSQPQASRNIPLFITDGTHLEIQREQTLPYRLVKNLGHGATASVEQVQDIHTGSMYARKSFRNVYSRNLEQTKKAFHNEVRVMRRLASHKHVVRVFASYVSGRELSLIIEPVADGGDLAAFLQSYMDLNDQDPRREGQSSIIMKAFGCLIVGLEFIHAQTIRHKDIKPQNILIHRGLVLYTDFGISLDHSERDRSTTTGNPQSFTRRYCAPEVADWDNRNSQSDIFSLGCVYIEMMNALNKRLAPDSLLEGPFHLNLELIDSHFSDLISADNDWLTRYDKLVVDTIRLMLADTPSERPNSKTLRLCIRWGLFPDSWCCDDCHIQTLGNGFRMILET